MGGVVGEGSKNQLCFTDAAGGTETEGGHTGGVGGSDPGFGVFDHQAIFGRHCKRFCCQQKQVGVGFGACQRVAIDYRVEELADLQAPEHQFGVLAAAAMISRAPGSRSAGVIWRTRSM